MNILASWAAHQAAAAPGLAIGLSAGVRADSLDGFAIWALVSGACFLVVTSPRSRWRVLFTRRTAFPGRALFPQAGPVPRAGPGQGRRRAPEPAALGAGRSAAARGAPDGAAARGAGQVTRLGSPERAHGPDDLATQGSLPAAVGIQPQPGQFPVAVLGVIREDSPRGLSRRSARQVEDKVGVLRHHTYCARPAPQFKRRCENRAISPKGTHAVPRRVEGTGPGCERRPSGRGQSRAGCRGNGVAAAEWPVRGPSADRLR